MPDADELSAGNSRPPGNPGGTVAFCQNSPVTSCLEESVNGVGQPAVAPPQLCHSSANLASLTQAIDLSKVQFGRYPNRGIHCNSPDSKMP